MPSRFADELARRVIVLDGAMGTSLFARGLDTQRDYMGCENCTDVLVATRPDVIAEIHESFLAAGADAVETDTFGASRLVLGEFGLADRCVELNRAAARIARAACERFSTPARPRFVLGSIGPGTRLATLGQADFDTLVASYRDQARGLIDGGVDALLIETCQDPLQIKAVINACLDELDAAGRSTDTLPILVSVTIETSGTMLVGTSIEAAATLLSGYPILSLGLNCATGPTEMTDHVRWLARNWSGSAEPGAGRPRAVSVVPNAGLPVLFEGRTEYPLRPDPFAAALVSFAADDGARIVGGCCGTTPEHIRRLADGIDALGLRSPPAAPRTAARQSTNPGATAPGVRPGSASLYSAVDHRQETSFLIVGERLNASGSRRFKQLLEAEDWDGVVALGKEQVRHDGAHVLDLNVDYAGRDNARDMAEIVSRVARQVDAPLMLDSTQPATIEAGLRRTGGKCIINSANFEDGDEKFDVMCRLARRFGAALIIGSIDEDRAAAMARTADRKLAIARRGVERATRVHGLAAADLFIDPLVLPVSTGLDQDRRSALETIEGVRRIARDLPEVQTCVGLSNVSFGLSPPARSVLNSAFLHELRAAGLTAAILHFSKIRPMDRIPRERWDAALDVIHDRRDGGVDPLQRFIALFGAEARTADAARPTAPTTVEDRLRAHIVEGDKEGLAATIDRALETYSPLAIINDHLLDGMKTVGDLFGSGRMQLPFVLQSAEVMKLAVSILEPRLERSSATGRGTIVLATVKGDVHDIGKNLVDIILSNNGYRVVNLGIKQPIADILRAWADHGADAIGMSGLLVKSVHVMEENLKELNARGVTAPVLLGGAALTRHYCESHLRSVYRGPCVYGKDAFEGLRAMDHIAAGRVAELAREADERAAKRSAAEEVIAASTRDRAAEQASAQGRGVALAATCRPAGAEPTTGEAIIEAPIPTPPFWGSRVAGEIDLDEVYPFINTVALFRGQWQLKKPRGDGADHEALIDDVARPIFDRLKLRARREGVLRPAVVYGYFPCNSDGDDLVIWDPAPFAEARRGPAVDTAPPDRREIERFRFPRQAQRRRLCISGFFRPAASGVADVVGMHCVTVGSEATRAARRHFEANEYAEYLYLHGLSVETAEALAEFWHKRMRQELGIAGDDAPRVRDLFTQKYRGSRYSFGYPACPDMSDQEKLFRLLRPDRIGCSLTENWQIDPEQSTSAIIVHHPAAKYFSV